MSTPYTPSYVCVGSIFIDDIVFPDGRTKMAILGGAGTHAAAGVAVWGERPGLIANAGTGMPESAWAQLQRDFDLAGVQQVDVPQGRAWQIFEWDNRRTEIFRTVNMEPFAFFPDPLDIPETYAHPRAATVLRGAAGIRKWREYFRDVTILWEPDSLYMQPQNLQEYQTVLSLPEIVSPNLLESQHIYDDSDSDPQTLIGRMLDDGAQIVALRMGEQGSLVIDHQNRKCIHFPPFPVPEIVDQTGAGNCYCGGFVVGWDRTHDLKLAGCYGAAAASFALETFGLANTAGADITAAREERLQWCVDHAQFV